MSLEILFYLITGLVLLVVGGELLVGGATSLASRLGISPAIIGLTVVAFGTSTPELAVSLSAAFGGNADIAVSNVVGSNIFNVLFILGLCACFRYLTVISQMIYREVPIMIGISLLLFVVAYNQHISQIEGLILFFGIIAYTTWLIVESLKHKSQNENLVNESSAVYGKKSKNSVLVSCIKFLIGLALVMLGARWMVDSSVSIAQMFGVSDAVIGLTIVAAGTSLPEVIASLIATLKGEREIAIGNVVGSNIYNILAIIGLSGALVPSGLKVSPSLLFFDIPIMIAAAVLCFVFFWTGRKLSRIEGLIFILLYALYTAVLIAKT